MQFGTYFAYWEQEWNADYNFYCKKIAVLQTFCLFMSSFLNEINPDIFYNADAFAEYTLNVHAIYLQKHCFFK